VKREKKKNNQAWAARLLFQYPDIPSSRFSSLLPRCCCWPRLLAELPPPLIWSTGLGFPSGPATLTTAPKAQMTAGS
jgi:hypothetical protein